MEYGPITWCVTSYTKLTHMVMIKFNSYRYELGLAWCRVLVCWSINAISGRRSPNFTTNVGCYLMKLKLLILSVSVSQLYLTTLLSKQPYLSPYLSANIVIGTFSHKTDGKFKFSDPTYPRKHSFTSTWSGSPRVHKRKLVMVGAAYSHRRGRKNFPP